MKIVCCDLESVYIPEIWVNLAKKTGIDELKITTKEEPDYNKLMKRRLEILKENNIKLKDIQKVIDTLDPLEGAPEFLDWLREKTQVLILSDTFKEFVDPFMKKLKRPTLLCHNLTIDNEGNIINYNLRQENAKQKVVEAIKSLNYQVISFGDSYNDVNMLKAADIGILFKPPQNVIDEFPEIPVARNYDELKAFLIKHL